mmetsp:Transcript_50512/g.107609  ORF Transcript_50512/g.107609 Transcript_50512/m.107609 type:complete len:96 (-) Transcript_50512:786-1073(-)|eukprot:CAMPEP_0172538066 /NCGR_PEP_ID=MMETSP1067-20121228/9541_1 /TAXON_ID=265564 ORGANISM="Thalassiosira punctigera, Strain Tpunct2005C2" /NCGR_SAMPLE_ID=MMETSP1067 /ASSEMBLY_ACC=CAM_ASM_000444 /LENGTH=95 /DNA_ID=CAMNT_0013323487 /DNA_START=188 /DNA_END=475 /DNA_ORIENTATION=-
MARGNQREQAREKNLKKLQAKSGGDQRAGTIHDRNASDKNALEAKVAAKKAAKEAEAAAGPAPKVVKPKGKKKEAAGLDDLLSAGLSGAKKKGKK